MLLWIAERVNLQNGGTFFIVCGPVYLKGQSKEEVMKKLSALDLSVSLRIGYSASLGEIPVLSSISLPAVI